MVQADEAPASAIMEIVQGRLYFVSTDSLRAVTAIPTFAKAVLFSTDRELQYEPFYRDFGPLNMALTVRFCQRLQTKLAQAQKAGVPCVYYCSPEVTHQANSAALIGIYQVLFFKRSVDEAYARVESLGPFARFHDASRNEQLWGLTVRDCLQGMYKAAQVGLIDWHLPGSSFSIEEWERCESLDFGDLNWIVPGKLVAFSGPAAERKECGYGYCYKVPEDYWQYFKQSNVGAVVRLNNKVYNAKRFIEGGFKHHEMYFPDGSCPSDDIVFKFLQTVEDEPQALAVHCKAGLGRTGVLICCYMMKHYDLTPEEAIAYIRICRPGSVIGEQQLFLINKMGPRMHNEGKLMRVRASLAAQHITPPTPPRADTTPARKPSKTSATIQSYTISASANSTTPIAARYEPASQTAPSVPAPARTSQRATTITSVAAGPTTQYILSSLFARRTSSAPSLPPPAESTTPEAQGASADASGGRVRTIRKLSASGQPRKVPAALVHTVSSRGLEAVGARGANDWHTALAVGED